MPSSRGAGSTHSPEPSAKPMSPDVNTGAGGVASACTPRVGRATATTATSTATASQVRRRETSLIRVPPPRVRLALDKPPGRPGPTVAETPAARGTANRRTRARWLGLVRGQRDGRGTRLGAGVAGPGGDAGRVVDGEGAVRGTPDVRRVEVTGRRRLPPRGRPGPCVPVGRGSAPRRLPCPAAPPGQRSR